MWGAFPDPDDDTLHIGGGVWTGGAGGSLLFPLVTTKALVASTWLDGRQLCPDEPHRGHRELALRDLLGDAG